MANQKNLAIVASLKEKLSRASSIVLTDYRGLTHKQLEDLHKAVKKAKGEYLVAKNSLIRIASQASSSQLPASDLSGPTAALFAYEEEIGPLKELFKTIKALGLPKIKFGFISGQRYNDSEIGSIAAIPAREVLYGQVVSRLSGPMSGLVYSLNYNLQRLVYALGQIKK